MDNFKTASQQKLRFTTSKGPLAVEQLWDLPLKELDELAVSLQAEYNQSAKQSFLVKSSKKDETAKLRFDIALDILNTLSAEQEAAAAKLDAKSHNEKIKGLIAKKQEAKLESLSEAELRKMLIK